MDIALQLFISVLGQQHSCRNHIVYGYDNYLRISIKNFFFQAEDGIRDLYVTGVQTCALPIWSMAATLASRISSRSSTTWSGGRPPWDRSEERRVGKECRCRWLPDR